MNIYHLLFNIFTLCHDHMASLFGSGLVVYRPIYCVSPAHPVIYHNDVTADQRLGSFSDTLSVAKLLTLESTLD